MTSGQMPMVVSIWSDIFDSQSGKSTSGRVQRRFPVGQTRVLDIWEETGESIARHVWDAGVAICSYVLDATTSCQKSPNLLEPLKNEARDLKIIELGSGCGIGGLAFALIAPNSPLAQKCEVLLTDLPEAMPILDFNISQNQNAESCIVESQILNWDDEASLEFLLGRSRFDIVLVSDCTYNCDSCPALVRTLSAIAKISNPYIIVFMKVRHESEGVFFTLMKDAGFSETSRDEIPLPHEDEGYPPSVYRQKIDIFTFRLSEAGEVPKAGNDIMHKRTFKDVRAFKLAKKLQTDPTL